ncbi:MAG: hypothetical protein K6E91_08725 [Butyrivibrio sp.]|nr:hypothetical protein [Butyrivibrio sp.]
MDKKFNEARELSLDELAGATGGYVYFNGDDPNYPYELIDDRTGNVIAAFQSKQDAIDSANLNGFSTKALSWDELNNLRKISGVY